MNISTIIGLVTGGTILVIAIVSSTQDPMDFVNLPGLGIVLGGTIAATLISFPMREVFRVFFVLKIILQNENTYVQNDLDEIIKVAQYWFKSDIHKAQSKVDELNNPYLKSALQLVIDQIPAEEIQSFINWRITKLRAKELAEARIFSVMGAYAPAFGMIGTLIGLINMLQTMEGQNFEIIGANMAIALVTTFYGILLANIIFKPVAIKFERRTEQRVMMMNIISEIITLLIQRKSPSYIRETINLMMMQYKNELDSKRV